MANQTSTAPTAPTADSDWKQLFEEAMSHVDGPEADRLRARANELKYAGERDADGRHVGARDTGAQAQPYATMAAVAQDVIDGKAPTDVAVEGVDVPHS